MAFRRRSGTSWVTPSNIRRRSGSSWVTIDTVRRRSGSSWITVYTSYTAVSATLSSARGTVTQTAPPVPPQIVEIAGIASAVAANGTGNYTYAWSITSGPAYVSGSSNSSSFQVRANVLGNQTVTGGLRCVVSDGVTSVTVNTTYSLTYNRII